MSTLSVWPVAVTYQNQPVTLVGAANIITALKDLSDSSYIQATIDNSTIYVSLDDITLTATQRVRYIQTNVRTAAAAGGTSSQILTVNANNCKGGTWSVAVMNVLRTTTGIQSFTSGFSNMAPGMSGYITADATSIDNMCLGIQWHKPTSGTVLYERVYAAQVLLDINEQPIITGAPVVTGTTTATPNIAWTYYDADLDPQSHYYVKVFTQTQVATGGFNADTTTPMWTTGDVKDPTTSDVTTSALAPGSYTAYVKVAQDWPGVYNGPLWWSAWYTVNFTIAFVLPYAPVIQTAAIVQDGNQYRTVLSVLTPVNLLTNDNSDFEGSVGQWTALANCAVIRDVAQFANGIASMKMTSSAAGDMTAQCALDFLGFPHVDGGQTYTIVANFRANSSARSCAIGVQWLDSANANIGAIAYGGSVTDSAANFNAQATFTVAAPGNARSAKITAKVIGTGAGGEIHWVDKVDIHAGSTVGWMPGGYSNNQGGLILQRGEYIDDRPGTADNWMHPQVASAGSVLRTAGFGFWWDSTKDSVTWKWLDKSISGAGATPPGMLDWVPGTATQTSLLCGYYIYGGTPYMTPAVPNQTHVASLWAWVSTGTQTVTLRHHWWTPDGTFISVTAGTNFIITTTPQQLAVTAVAPSNAGLASVELVNFNSDNTKHFYATRIGFGLGTVPVDGRQPLGLNTGMTSTNVPVGPLWTNVRYAADGSVVDTQSLPGFPEGYSTGQVDTVVDYEYPPGRPVIYRASITYSFSGTTIASAYSNFIVAYNAPPPVTLLRSTTSPTLQVAVNRRKDTAYSPNDDAQVFHPLGADAAPIRIRDWASGADGNLTVITSTDAQAARLNALVMSNDVLQIQWAQGGRTYCFITDRQISEVLSSDIDFCDADGTQPYLRYRVWTISYMETVAP